jgi:hypothetical protein
MSLADARLNRLERKLEALQAQIDAANAAGDFSRYEKLVLKHAQLTDKYVNLSMRSMGN